MHHIFYTKIINLHYNNIRKIKLQALLLYWPSFLDQIFYPDFWVVCNARDCILYKKGQDVLVDKTIIILELDNVNSVILYNLDNGKTKQDKILELISEIIKYCSFSDYYRSIITNKNKETLFINN